MSIKKRTVGVIGIGHVGAHVGFCLGMMGVADVVRLCDTNEQKVASEVNDLNDAVKFMPHRVKYIASSYEDLKDCDVIVNSVGNIELLVATMDRDDEMEYTVGQVKQWVPKVMAGGFNGIIVNITNPCDVITNLISELSGLPKGHVLGTGTCLDTARLVNALSQQTDVAPASIMAYMMGEHGNAQMAPWSIVTFGGKKLSDLQDKPQFVFDHEEMKTRAIKGGWVTFVGKHCTEYAIASAAVTIVRAILHDTKEIMATSCPLDGQYGETGIFAGCPAVVGANGVEEVVEFDLPADELAAFKDCCQKIRDNIDKSHKL